MLAIVCNMISLLWSVADIRCWNQDVADCCRLQLHFVCDVSRKVAPHAASSGWERKLHGSMGGAIALHPAGVRGTRLRLWQVAAAGSDGFGTHACNKLNLTTMQQGNCQFPPSLGKHHKTGRITQVSLQTKNALRYHLQEARESPMHLPVDAT